MRIEGSTPVSKRWPKRDCRRLIARLANRTKLDLRRDDPMWEILDRIDMLASYVPWACEIKRDYILKGSRYAEEDRRAS
jgi:hypothetical protein